MYTARGVSEKNEKGKKNNVLMEGKIKAVDFRLRHRKPLGVEEGGRQKQGMETMLEIERKRRLLLYREANRTHISKDSFF
jgi:hypothetical protein